MLGVALEGGGSKGAYHMGVIKAYLEEGFQFQGAVGTSIGAINAALFAQGDFEMAYELWRNMTPSTLFDIEDAQLKKFRKAKLDEAALTYLYGKIKKILADRGLDTSKIRLVLDTYINEEKLRRSPMDYGLVTVSLTDKKALELFKEDIPQGKLVDYIMASASFPGFKLEPLDGKYYIDGGLYDNCPVNMLIRKGYQDIIAIRTLGMGFIRKFESNKVNITTIIPSGDLGTTLSFENDIIRNNLKMGYYDGLRAIRGLKGHRYYIKTTVADDIFALLAAIPEKIITDLGTLLSLPPMEPKKMLFEEIIPQLSMQMKDGRQSSYEDFLITLLEHAAGKSGVDPYQIYTPQELTAAAVGKKQRVKNKPTVMINHKPLLPLVKPGANLNKAVFLLTGALDQIYQQ